MPRWRRGIRWLLIVVMGGLFFVGYGPDGGHDHPGEPGIWESLRQGELGQAWAAAVQKYTCSMHPFIIRDHPGNCPICGMALVPVKPSTTGAGGGGGNTGVITVDPATQQSMGIRTAKVVRKELQRAIRTVGVVGYEEPRQYSINAKVDGWVERLYVNETGGTVKKGQPLLSIYSPDLVTAQEEFLLARRNNDALKNNMLPEIAEGAKQLLESSRKRLRYWDISEAQIAALARSGTVAKNLVLYAPYNGIVTAKRVEQGMYVKAGMELFQLSDISRVWVYADVYEYELPWVKVGQTVRIELPYGAPQLTGTVDKVYPYVESKTRTVKARISLDNRSLQLKPDMYVTVRLAASTVKDVLVVPAEAVLYSGEKTTVFVALGGGKFEPRPVTLGLQDDHGLVEVRSGLKADEVVVTSAQFMLDSESTLRGAFQKMSAPKPPPAPAAPGKKDENLEDLFK